MGCLQFGVADKWGGLLAELAAANFPGGGQGTTLPHPGAPREVSLHCGQQGFTSFQIKLVAANLAGALERGVFQLSPLSMRRVQKGMPTHHGIPFPGAVVFVVAELAAAEFPGEGAGAPLVAGRVVRGLGFGCSRLQAKAKSEHSTVRCSKVRENGEGLGAAEEVKEMGMWPKQMVQARS